MLLLVKKIEDKFLTLKINVDLFAKKVSKSYKKVVFTICFGKVLVNKKVTAENGLILVILAILWPKLRPFCIFDVASSPTSGAIPVIMATRIHLFPFRTQKLSSSAVKVLGTERPGG